MHRIFAAVAVVLAATTAHAQQDFGPIKLKPGQQVQVIEDGLTLHGKVMSVAPDDLVVNDHHLKPGPGLRIDRDRGNTAWKGAASAQRSVPSAWSRSFRARSGAR